MTMGPGPKKGPLDGQRRRIPAAAPSGLGWGTGGVMRFEDGEINVVVVVAPPRKKNEMRNEIYMTVEAI